MSDKIHGFIYEKDSDAIVTITMDMDGPVNAMNGQYREAMAVIPGMLEAELESEQGLKGVVLASAKGTFFAGGDLKELSSVPKGAEEGQFRMIEDKIKAPLRRLEKLPVPVVAAINGAALGGGFEICLACNHRIVANHSRAQIGLPEVTLGLLPGGGGVVRSIHLLGLEKALPFLLEGKRMSPQQALDVGFVDALTDMVEKLVPAAKAWIKANPEACVQPWDMKGHKIPGGDVWNPKVVNTLAVAPAVNFRKTRGLLPAPERILAVAADTVTVDFESALRIESRGLAYLITTPQAKNIITSSFFQLNKINSGASRPADAEPSKVSKVGILGAGMMGQGIAFAAARAGIEAVLIDTTDEAAEKGKAYSARLMDKQIKAGRKTEADKSALLGRIKASADYASLQGCDLIVEAVFENVDLKAKVTVEAQQYLSEGGVFATNTSTLPINLLSEVAERPENYIGIHFFSPVEKMPLIEIICGQQTSDSTLAKAFDFARQLRKTPIVVNDSLGFFTSRVFGTFMDEGARLLVEGLDPVLIDALGKQVGMPVGPLAVQDEVSQELTRKVSETHRQLGVFCSLGDNSCNTEVSEKLIAEFGRGGRHHGGGYYEYPEGAPKKIWPKLYELYHKPEVEMPHQDIKDRILFRQVVESLKCLQEGVLRSVADGNVGSLLGIGAPTWTGGFLQVVNTYEYNGKTGPEAFADRCDELAGRYGERFAAPEIVRQKLEAGESFA
ncbi:3-hydroxyacyl-CoA dehydrogenase NAD-binding domain-containing protein [Biformimicrobium ophioploci]|uniref:3-hydroxyacyl-CoA dehydrogenase NAD-binding domain-containing protein n=1 Tax=Biformimicrobium ophioploci TaxID=3036711 RepID=A0ABQ6M245_9GAMM|nr:3-hydroxyacyl-CoA dehydrogenase NAD-binding domain-containing protein [Microbulbifer sp. NKW57]GMG88419.1 3-hydroxyacyl-CoA dehydrogenase NAD-binding domain-containing protein [Microbulbifer sp. NKW57]